MSNEQSLEPRHIIGAPQKREEVTALLIECYARGLMSLEEYERRVELAHDAAADDDLESLVRDVPLKVRTAFQSASAATLTVDNSVLKVDDRRLAVPRLALSCRGGVVTLDYRIFDHLPERMTIDMEAAGSVIKLIVPADVEVSVETESTASVVKYRRGRRHRRTPVQTSLRITGGIQRSVIKIVTRRKRRR